MHKRVRVEASSMPKPTDPADDAGTDDEVSSVGTPSQAESSIVDEIDDEDGAGIDVVAQVRSYASIQTRVSKRRVQTRVADEDRITTNVLGVYAATALIAARTTQIGRFGNALIDTAPYSTNEEVATAELIARKCPIYVRRKVGERDRGDYIEEFYEYHHPSEMILPKSLMMGK